MSELIYLQKVPCKDHVTGTKPDMSPKPLRKKYTELLQRFGGQGQTGMLLEPKMSRC